MLTDAPPRNRNRAGFLESDRIRALDLPQNGCLLTIAKSIESATQKGKLPMAALPAGSFSEKQQNSTESRNAAFACSQPDRCECAKTGRGSCSATTTRRPC